MRLLIDASLPRRTAEAIERADHQYIDVRDIVWGRRPMPKSPITRKAMAWQLSLATLTLAIFAPEHATADEVTQLLASFLGLTFILQSLDGCLAIVEPGRVRIRK
jgi:hypothetical protein